VESKNPAVLENGGTKTPFSREPKFKDLHNCAERSAGRKVRLIRQQCLFVGPEGIMVGVPVLAPDISSPAFCFGTSMDAKSVFAWVWRGKTKNVRRTVTEIDAALEKRQESRDVGLIK
jgi:hypothetical protein